MSHIIRFIKTIVIKPIATFKTFSRRKKMVVICVVVVFSFISTQIFSKASKQPQYTISKATKNTIIEVVSETGTIAATGKTDVYSPTNGIIETIFVRNGDTVIEGQELFTVIHRSFLPRINVKRFWRCSITCNQTAPIINRLRIWSLRHHIYD